MTKRLTYSIVAFLLVLPCAALAQSSATSTPSVPPANGFTRDGIFGCNASQYGGSPGTTAAIGGTYVPVVDASVTLNTGVIVYKECVLEGIAARMSENVTASIAKNGIVAFQNGRLTFDANGNLVQKPLYPENLSQDRLIERDRGAVLAIKSNASAIHPSYRAEMQRAVARAYYNSTRQAGGALACPYNDLENAFKKGSPQSVPDALDALQNPACTKIGVYNLYRERVLAGADRTESDMLMRLSWNNGVYDVSTVNEQGEVIVQTPGRFVGASQEQFITSGFRQAEMGKDIDQMVGALFAGMSAEIIRSAQGLAGLTQPRGNQPSYLDQVTAAAQQGLRGAINNAAIAILRDAQLVEKAYGDIMRAILNQMKGTQSNLQAAERQCWSTIIQKTCAPGTLKADGTCTALSSGCTTDTNGTQTCPVAGQLKVATSTIYSQAAIANSPVFNLLPTVERNVQVSDNAMKLFATLIEGVNGAASQSAQLQAQLQLESLINQGLIHKQSDVEQAIASKKAVDASIAQGGTYVKEVAALWNGDAADGTAGVAPWNGTYPPKSNADIVGWCNVNNAETITKWSAQWRK